MACPDPETMAQYVEGSLPEFGREALLEHLGGCDGCREMVLVLTVEKRATERRIPLRRKRFAWGGWVAAAAVLATAFVVWKALPARQPSRVPGESQLTKAPDPVEPSNARPPADAGPVVVKPPPPVDPGPRPPVDPAPKPPVDPPPPVDPGPKPPVDPGTNPPLPPTRALAALRLLDIQGRLVAEGKPVAEGAAVTGTLTAPEGAGFHVDGHLVAMATGVSLTLSRDGDVLVFEARKGEVFVQPRGEFTIRAAGRDLALTGAGIVTEKGPLPFKDKPAADKARAKFAKWLPARRTILFEDFAAIADGFERSTAQGGPIFGARVMLPEPADWSRKLAIRIRVRSAARTVQVGVLFRDRVAPWAAMATTAGDDWREITVRASDFSAGPTGAAAPAEGDDIAGLTFSINTQEPGTSGASLDLDDLAISLEE
ncbi:MAG: zf-HC2 domain-containing protein [Planctomycetota bacterium]